jgi:hypothetical protein
MYKLKQNQVQRITFVMVSDAGTEVPGLAGTFDLEVSKNGAPFAAGVGAKAEISAGWYLYTLAAAETDTVGPLAVRITAAGCAQQNLEYVVVDRAITAIAFTYTVTNAVTTLPIEGVDVAFSTDNAGANVVWNGQTDTLGVARDDDGALPRLDPGTYYVWRSKAGFTFSDPDTETVS